MKIAKKTAAFLLVLFLGIQCMPLTALAADGTLSFSDPTAKAGETIDQHSRGTDRGWSGTGYL